MFFVLFQRIFPRYFFLRITFILLGLFFLPSVTHASITPSISPSRTTGVAPLAVFFDASATTGTGTTRPFHEIEYDWNFGDNDESVWNYGSHVGDGTATEKKNRAKGPVAAHVFEFAGTYTVTLSLFDGTDTTTATQVITVTDPLTVFSGTNTICIAATVVPVANSDGCPSGAAVAQQSDWATIVSTYVATGKRILLRHDNTFTTATAPSITVTGPGTIGMYGSGAKPILQATADIDGGLIQLSSQSTPGIGDWRFMDLEFDSDGHSTRAISPSGGINQVTYLRLYSHVTSYSFLWSASILDYWNNNGSPGHTIYDQIAMVDCKTFGSYTSYIYAKRLMIMGNDFNNNLEGEHTIRAQYVNGAVISNNTLQGQAPTKSALTIRASHYGAANSVATTSNNGVSENIVVSGNKLLGNAGDNWTVFYGPQGAIYDERINDIITERNWFVAGSGTSQLGVLQAANHTIRNNIFDNTAGGDPITIASNPAYVPATWSHDVSVYNNTMYSARSTASFDAVSIHGGSSSVILKNNIAYAPGISYDAFYRCDGSRSCAGMTGFVASDNSTDTDSTDQIKSTAPSFLNSTGLLSTPSDFFLRPGSYARDSGASVPVWSDFFGVRRPHNASYDMGAYEYTPLTLSLVPSRTTGVAPLSVFFDASGTTDTGVTAHPFHEIEYTWNFGDDDSATWAYGSHVGDGSDLAKKNRAKGPVSAHVFEPASFPDDCNGTPCKTFTVTLSVFDGVTTTSTTQEIIVTNPTAVFSGTNTICFSTVGDFTDCPSDAQTVTTNSFETAVNTYLATSKRLLFHRGETFTSITSAYLDKNGPWTVGAYGSGAKPIMHTDITTSLNMVSLGSRTGGLFISDGRFMDIVLDAGDGAGGITGTSTIAMNGGSGTFDQMVFLRTDVSNMHGGFFLSSSHLSVTAPDRKWDQFTIQDSTVYNLVNSGGNGMYLESKRMALLGNSVDNNGGAEHNFRSMYWNGLVVSNNTFTNPNTTKANISLRAPNYNSGTAVTPFHVWSNRAVVSDNEMTGTGGSISVATFDDSGNGGGDQRRRDVIFERNWWHDQPGSTNALSLSSDTTTARNNIMNLSAGGGTCVTLDTTNNPNYNFGTDWIYNNVCYTTSLGDAWGEKIAMRVYADVGSVKFFNNLVYMPNVTNAVHMPMTDVSAGPITSSNNSTSLQARTVNPLFRDISGNLSAPSDYQVTTSSYAKDAGISVPLFSDFFGISRPQNSLYDIGAFEFVVPDTTAPVLSEVTPVDTPATDTTPDYTFSTTEGGALTYGGDCTSATTTALSGSNTITFATLSVATHSNCTITVTDSSLNASTPLSVTAFTIDVPSDTTPPTLTESSAIATSTDTTPDYTFSTTEGGTLTYGGDCTSSTTTATSGTNTITFATLSAGTHTNCTIQVTDASSNASTPLAITSFTITEETVPTPEVAGTFSSSKSKPKKKKISGNITYKKGERSAPWITLLTPTSNTATNKKFTIKATSKDKSGIQAMFVSINGIKKKRMNTDSILYTAKKRQNASITVSAYDTLGNVKIAQITITDGKVSGVRYY